MTFFIIFICIILSFVHGSCWYVSNDNEIRWGTSTNCGKFIGFTQYYDNKTDWFQFNSGCCGENKTYYKIYPGSNEAEKAVDFVLGTEIQTVWMYPSQPDKHFSIYLRNIKEGFVGIFKRSSIPVSGINNNIYVYNTPAVIIGNGYERFYIRYQSYTNRPYLNLQILSTTTIMRELYVNKRNIQSGCNYAFNTNGNVDVYDAQSGCIFYEVCSKPNLKRYVMCKNETLSIKNDCRCYIPSTTSTASVINFGMVFPDCIYNSSLYDLTIFANQTIIKLDSTKGYQWNSFIFESRTLPLTIENDQLINLTGTTTLPNKRIIISNVVYFNKLIIPTVNFDMTHVFREWDAIDIDVSQIITDSVLFIGYFKSSGIPNTIRVGCNNGNFTRYVKGTSTIDCQCTYSNDQYDLSDCEIVSKIYTNTLNLILNNNIYDKENVYWNSVVIKYQNSLIKGSITSKSCSIEQSITINGLLQCNILTLSGNSIISISEDGKLIVTNLIVEKQSTVTISSPINTNILIETINIYGSLLFDDSTSVISQSKTILNQNSQLKTINYASIKELQILGTSTLKSDSNIFISTLIQTTSRLNVDVKQLEINKGDLIFGSVNVVNPIIISNFVSTIDIESITNPLIDPNLMFITTDHSTTPLNIMKIPSIPNSISINFILNKYRKINLHSSNNINFICDKQAIVIGTGNDLICSVIGLTNKVCNPQPDNSYLDENGFHDYSCPGHSNSIVSTYLIIDSVNSYSFESDERYNLITLLRQATLYVSYHDLLIKSYNSFIIDGTLNSVLVESIGNSSSVIVTSLSPLLLFVDNSLGITISTNNAIISSYGLCKTGLLSNTNSECKICRYLTKEDGECTEPIITIEHCELYRKNGLCERCEEGFFSTGNSCNACTSNCKICNSEKCLLCFDNYIVSGTKCIETSNCKYMNNGICLVCPPGKTQDPSMEKCSVNCPNGCDTCSSSDVCIHCSVNNSYIKNNNQCELKQSTNQITSKQVIDCQDGFYLKKGSCISCENDCSKCLYDDKTETIQCLECPEGKIIVNGKSCQPIDSVGCKTSVNSKCIVCTEFDKYFDGSNCVSCGSNCSLCTVNGKCSLCDDSTYLKLDSTFDDGICQSTPTIENCKEFNKGRCAICSDGYFLNKNGGCDACYYPCKKCVKSADICYECNEGFSLQENSCISIIKSIENCKQTIPHSNDKCLQCEDGYYRDGILCRACIDNCKTCIKKNECSECSKNFYKNITYGCSPISELTHCEEITNKGCSLCESGYYLENFTCHLCSEVNEHCTECNQINKQCKGCTQNYILTNESHCVFYNQVKGCIEASHSVCLSCTFWYTPSNDGLSCERHPVWWVVLVIVILIIFIIITVFILFVFGLYKILFYINKKNLQNKSRKTCTHFEIKYSNIHWIELNEKCPILVNKKVLTFDTKTTEIPVNKETRELLCIANRSKHTLQISLLEEDNLNENYSIRTNPLQIILKKKEGCELEVFINPHCSVHLIGIFKILIDNLSTGKRYTVTISIDCMTEVSCRLSPNDIVEERIIGEGSFGVVFLGYFKGNKVAIKKLKKLQVLENMINEFKDEVLMLEKFRNEYIVHFYGAVMIPNKLCFVTEFAEYGSLSDLIEKRMKNNPLDEKLKIKFCLDAAKGIEYLHSNGILHRDIKPDNILAISLEKNVEINGKLTDFGSSRNINMLMTNMTFTKGIGTPVYMAPEILKKDKYKMPADVYSFAVTMLHILMWDAPYQGSLFKYPWSIANFVADGNRLDCPENVSPECFELIEQAWVQNPKERLSINEIVIKLQQLYDIIQIN
ncbi:hypothetical protein ENUP19_0020G0012 [Entamoeba nuttalli]|uniref:Protein kinase, putative n=2 Tax=Entamoeba nuttalli TaxID=412467 RepID=K2GQR7_ENTNP|nr:protein kinase, putative [Entamoeba nuttalli P19]EKE37303.1 protein kinase, putative [Entamoeba nuttalli P19]|eukprot:XP_008860361.1 protein kinase, putative [Entamoeba nuttalli P19]